MRTALERLPTSLGKGRLRVQQGNHDLETDARQPQEEFVAGMLGGNEDVGHMRQTLGRNMRLRSDEVAEAFEWQDEG